ncbi:hypothetical protein EDB19DRAFT_371841 [Suillus lakei]|nr:hypothetical protein EDB19DRAFT_371841 [Suillus lakei]
MSQFVCNCPCSSALVCLFVFVSVPHSFPFIWCNLGLELRDGRHQECSMQAFVNFPWKDPRRSHAQEDRSCDGRIRMQIQTKDVFALTPSFKLRCPQMAMLRRMYYAPSTKGVLTRFKILL